MMLFLFEGKKPEFYYFDELCKKTNIDIKAKEITYYGTVIYQLYKELEKDDYLDLPALLEEKRNLDLSGKKFTEIYLFFDYDSHATNADNQKLIAMFDFFNNETEKGKLFISYPMIEALRHIKDNATKNITHCIDKHPRYKSIIDGDGIEHLNQLSRNEWKALINRHLEVANNLVNDIDALPKNIIEQNDIFNKQIEKHIKPHKEVVVLSAIPLFYLDYMGIQGAVSLDFA